MVWVGLCLIDSLDLVFDGIFDGLDVDVLAVNRIDEGVEGGRVAGSGGSGDEAKSLIAMGHVADEGGLAWREVEF